MRIYQVVAWASGEGAVSNKIKKKRKEKHYVTFEFCITANPSKMPQRILNA